MFTIRLIARIGIATLLTSAPFALGTGAALGLKPALILVGIFFFFYLFFAFYSERYLLRAFKADQTDRIMKITGLQIQLENLLKKTLPQATSEGKTPRILAFSSPRDELYAPRSAFSKGTILISSGLIIRCSTAELSNRFLRAWHETQKKDAPEKTWTTALLRFFALETHPDAIPPLTQISAWRTLYELTRRNIARTILSR